MSDTGPSGELELIKELGRGAFGVVFLVKDGEEKLAMKMIDMAKMTDAKMRRNCVLEATLFRRELKHENILNYMYSFESEGHLCIVTEYCPYGDLGVYLAQRRMAGETLEEPRVVEWFRQITSGLQFLHSKKIIHRDLKTNNVFLTSSWDTKLGDLGIAKVLETPTEMAATQCGTPSYMSPEIFIGLPYNFKSDVWALGVVVYEMSTLERPFDGFILQHIMFKVIHGALPEMPRDFNQGFVKLLTKMMSKMPDDRPSTDDILADSIFKTTPKPTPLPPKVVNDEDDEEEDARAGMLGMLHLAAMMAALAEAIEMTQLETQNEDTTVCGVDADVDADSTLTSEMTAEATVVMEHVMRTLVGMGHAVADSGKKDHKTTMKNQVDMLKLYILKVLDDNQTLFKKACAVLDQDHDQDSLEEALIQVLGHEKFGLCGMQLLYYKNFTYNLRDL